MSIKISPIAQNIPIYNFNNSNIHNAAVNNKNHNQTQHFKGLEEDYTRRSMVNRADKVSQIANNEVLNSILDEFKKFPQVEAISIGGSNAANTADSGSDIDIEIFTNGDIPKEDRLKIIQKYSSKYDVGQEYFGPDDEFYADKIDTDIDICYFDKKMMEDNVQNVWQKHKPSNGYTTCFLFTLKNCTPVYDKEGWLSGVKKQLNTPYPKELKQNIIHNNMQLLKDKPFASYYEQIEKAVKRDDKNSINHRTAAFMASYFDIIFAMNEKLHPGEKKLVKYAKENCPILPESFEENIEKLYTCPQNEILEVLDCLVEELRKFL